MRRTFRLICLGLLLAGLAAFVRPASASVRSGLKGKKIVEVEVSGPNVKTAARLKLILRTREGTPYDPETTDKDVKELFARNLVEDVSVFVTEVEGGVKVTFKVIEKRVIVRIVFDPPKLYVRTSVLKGKLLSKEGEYYSFALASQDEEIIAAKLRKYGYLKVKVKHSVEEVPGGVNLVFKVDQGPRYAVGEIRFVGNASISARKLRRKMRTKKKDLFHSGALDEMKLKADLEIIRRMYLDEGFLDVKVELEPIDLPEPPPGYKMKKKHLFPIVIKIDEGPRYRIASVSFTGDTVLDEDELRSLLVVKPGDYASLKKIDKSAMNIVDAFGEMGRAFTEVKPEIVPAATEGKVDVIFHIRQSNVVRVQEVIIQGNEVTKEHVIRRELRVYPGEFLTTKGVRESLRNLSALGYFEDARISYAPRSEDLTDVIVTVKEGKTASLMFGGGVSNAADVFVNLTYTERNFDIGDVHGFKGGGQQLKLSLNVGATMTSYNLDFFDPHVKDSDYSFGVGTSRREYDRSTYDDKRIEGHMMVGKHLSEHVTVTLQFTFEYVEIENVEDDAPLPVKLDEGSHNLASVGVRLRYRDTDKPFIPTEGWDASIGAYFYTEALGSDYDFYKVLTRASRYWKVYTTESGASHTLMARLKVNYMEEMGGTDTIPTFERLYQGGVNSVRGWQAREIGPRMDGEPIGGYFSACATLEYYFPIYQDVLHFAVFFDAGGAWPTAGDFDTSDLRYGTGFGLYIRTPLSPAPLRIYYTDALNPKDGEDTEVVQFSFGFFF